MPRDQIFISYSHKDKKCRDALNTHLKPYLRNGSITSWSDQQIAAGSQWFEEIQSALTDSKIAVLLVSPDFFDSDFIHQHELGPLLKNAEQGGVKIFWVPVRDSGYKQTALKNYQALLDPAKPLAGMTQAKRDQAWLKICEEIQRAVNNPTETRQSLVSRQMDPADQRSPSQDLQSNLPALSSSSSAPSLPAFDSIIVPPTPDTFSSDQRLLADASARVSKRSQSIDIERPVPFRRASSRRAALANAEPQALDGLDIPNDYPDIGFFEIGAR
jgi:TIR domain